MWPYGTFPIALDTVTEVMTKNEIMTVDQVEGRFRTIREALTIFERLCNTQFNPTQF